ncbi:MAG: hypothetical protein HFF77_04625 [Oscillospiraceae bacterium]|jgi:hypothetical protein|nr:hypothetical protein [Oscillospiraceae bacterium]
MSIYPIDESNAAAVARLMSSIKPDWWDFEGARRQLRDVSLLAKLIGWYLGDSEKPKGWILCAEYEGYSYLSVECLGYDENGTFVMEQQIEPLLQCAEEHARAKGYRNLKYIISSTDMSCHGRPITNYADELKGLKSNGREHFDYFVRYGFSPTGFIPSCYGENHHGIVMIKPLRG